MSFLFPIVAAVLQAASFTLDKIILSIRRVNFKTYAGASFPLVFLAILKLYAPILPFIAEDVYQAIYGDAEGAKSIHISAWPKEAEIAAAGDVSDFDKAIAAIDEIRKYKSEQDLSLGAELEEYALDAEIDFGKYGDFVKNAVKVKKLTMK